MEDSLIIDGEKYKILHYFKYNNDNFIIYNNEHNNEILASKFTLNNDKISLLPINDNEWQIVDKELEKIDE